MFFPPWVIFTDISIKLSYNEPSHQFIGVNIVCSDCQKLSSISGIGSTWKQLNECHIMVDSTCVHHKCVAWIQTTHFHGCKNGNPGTATCLPLPICDSPKCPPSDLRYEGIPRNGILEALWAVREGEKITKFCGWKSLCPQKHNSASNLTFIFMINFLNLWICNNGIKYETSELHICIYI